MREHHRLDLDQTDLCYFMFKFFIWAERERKKLSWSPVIRQASLEYPPCPRVDPHSVLSSALIFAGRETQTSIAFLDYPSNPICSLFGQSHMLGFDKSHTAEEYDSEIRRIFSPGSSSCRSVNMPLVNSSLPSYHLVFPQRRIKVKEQLDCIIGIQSRVSF